MVSDERALATWLAERDDVALARLLADRGVSPSIGWHDFFDAAAGLLDPASLDRALIRLPRAANSRPSPTVIPAASEHARLARAAGPGRSALRHGRRAARRTDRRASGCDRRRAAHRPSAAQRTRHRPPLPPRRRSRRRALSPTCCSPACTRRSRAPAPARISAADRKRLTEAGAVGSPEELEDLVESAVAAGLTRPLEREWVVTERRRALARVGDGRIAGRRSPKASAPRCPRPAHGVGRLPPASSIGHAPTRSTRSGRRARHACAASPSSGACSTPTAPSRRGRSRCERARTPIRSPDRSPAPPRSIASTCRPTSPRSRPGPLAPHLDLRLRGIARRESRAQASTYRFTADSLGAGMTEGETAQSIREFLATISLTGIPQPLDYLIESTAARHGLVRVRADAATDRTRVESPSAACSTPSPSTRRCARSGLVHDGDALVSRVARDAVYWSLADARYPVVALGPSGTPEPLHRRARRRRAPRPVDPRDVVRAAHRDAARRPQHRRRGRVARSRARAGRAGPCEIIVVVKMPDGAERTFTLEASGLGGGRLRGRDNERRHRADAARVEHRERRTPHDASRPVLRTDCPGRIDPYG